MGDVLEEVRRSPERTPHNLWRRETPGAAGWPRSARPGDPAKYFMFSADCHAQEPATYLEGIEPEFRDRIPRMDVRPDGSQWLITEHRRQAHGSCPYGTRLSRLRHPESAACSLRPPRRIRHRA